MLIQQPPLLVHLQLVPLAQADLPAQQRLHVARTAHEDELAIGVDAIPLRFQGPLQLGDRPGGVGLLVVPAIEELQEDPLRPLVVLDIRGAQPARPVVAEAEHLDLPLDVGDVLLGGDARVHAVLDGVLLGRQAEGVVAHRVQHVVAAHARVPGDDIGGGVALGVPHVQAGAGGVGKHVQHVQLGRLGVKTRLARADSAEAVVRSPVVLPLLLDGRKIVRAHNVPRSKSQAESLCHPSPKACATQQKPAATWDPRVVRSNFGDWPRSISAQFPRIADGPAISRVPLSSLFIYIGSDAAGQVRIHRPKITAPPGAGEPPRR